jgi:hypothetical protein
VPRVELDQRSREAHLRLEQIERLLMPRAAVTRSRLRWLLYFFRVNRYPGAPQKRPLSDWWPSGMPIILELWLENAELRNSPSGPIAICKPGDIGRFEL